MLALTCFLLKTRSFEANSETASHLSLRAPRKKSMTATLALLTMKKRRHRHNKRRQSTRLLRRNSSLSCPPPPQDMATETSYIEQWGKTQLDQVEWNILKDDDEISWDMPKHDPEGSVMPCVDGHALIIDKYFQDPRADMHLNIKRLKTLTGKSSIVISC
jgi:hypothetical protein